MAEQSKPKELYIDEHWDRFIDLTVRRAVYGALTGGAAGLLLARGPTARVAAAAFGVGIGVGSAFSDSQKRCSFPGDTSIGGVLFGVVGADTGHIIGFVDDGDSKHPTSAATSTM